MTIISYNKNFIFVKSRKTGGTSMEIALSKFCGAEDIIAPIGPFGEDERKSRKFLSPQNYINKKKPKKFFVIEKDNALNSIYSSGWEN